MKCPYEKFSKTKFFKFVVYNDDNPNNKNSPFLSMEMPAQHKIVFIKMSMYVGLILFYIFSLFTIGINWIIDINEMLWAL